MRTFLSVYTIRIKKGANSRQPKDTTLSNFNGFDDCKDVLKTFLENLSRNATNKTHNTYLKTASIESKERIIEGVFESGSYGLSSKIMDVDTDTVHYKKGKNDADVMPYYFLINIPKDTDEGIIILQRTGKHGVRTNFGNFLNKHFSEKYPNYSVEINTLVREELIKKILYGGVIKKLRCVKYKAHVDAFDGIDNPHEENPYSMEVVLSANRIPFVHKIKEFLDSSNKNIKTLVEIRDFKFDYDTVKVDVETNGSTKTFDLEHLYKVKAYYDITSEVKFDRDDYPTFPSIQLVARKYLEEIIQEIYFSKK
jgi:hypothetical protein